MPKFKVITSSVIASEYTVEAKDITEAEEKFWQGEYTDYKELSDYEIDSQEEILEVQNA